MSRFARRPMSVSVSTLVPHQAVIEMPKSTSKHVLRRRQVEILPLESTKFSYAGNDSIKFNISSNTELLDGMNSYIKMGFLAGVEGGAVATLALDVGGAHALFREISLMTQNGTMIQRYERYNRWYAMMSLATHSPQHVELVEASAGDSVDGLGDIALPYRTQLTAVGGFSQSLSLTPTNVAIAGDAAPRPVTFGAGSVGGEVAVGDNLVFTITGGNAGLYVAPVNAVTDNKDGQVEITIGQSGTNNNIPVAAIGAGNIINVAVIKNSVIATTGNTYSSQRAKVAQALAATYPNGVPLMWKPAVSFLQQKQWIPLAFIKQGLQLELKLDRPEYVMNKNQTPANQNDAEIMDYTIYSPRFVAMMITPDESIMAEYLAQFNGEGIHMSILGYRHNRQTITQATSGTQVINHHYGVRSARHVFSVIQSSLISESTGAQAKGNYSLSTFLRSFVSYYQYKSGSEEYPNRRVECDNFSTEAFAQLMLATNQHGGTLWNVRFNPSEWRNDNTIISSVLSPAGSVDSELAGRSTKFIMATRLDRNDDNFTGLDLSINPLDLELNFSAVEEVALGNRIVHSFVGHDILVSLSADGLVVRK